MPQESVAPGARCVIKEEQRIAAGKAAPAAAPKADNAVGPVDTKLAPAVFVPPPRTIADITAILDQEKPDAARIAKAKADADAAPPEGASTAKLVQFYYDRGAARSFLARNTDAFADGKKRLRLARARSISNKSRASANLSPCNTELSVIQNGRRKCSRRLCATVISPACAAALLMHRATSRSH